MLGNTPALHPGNVLTRLNLVYRESEVRQLANWIESVEKISRELQIEGRKAAVSPDIEDSQSLVRSVGTCNIAQGSEMVAGQCATLVTVMTSWSLQVNGKCMKLRSQFFSDLRRQLYTDADDLKYFDDVSTSLRSIQRRLHESTAAVSFLREQLFLVTCDDPGPLITMKLVLPMFRERLDALIDAHAAKQAEAAEAELLSTV